MTALRQKEPFACLFMVITQICAAVPLPQTAGTRQAHLTGASRSGNWRRGRDYPPPDENYPTRSTFPGHRFGIGGQAAVLDRRNFAPKNRVQFALRAPPGERLLDKDCSRPC